MSGYDRDKVGKANLNSRPSQSSGLSATGL